MRDGLTVVTMLIGYIFCTCSPAQTTRTMPPAARRSQCVAKALEVHGKWYRLIGKTKTKITNGQDVYPDWELNCDGNGSIVLLYVDGGKEFVRPGPSPYMVSHIAKDTGFLNSIRVPACGARGDGNPIYSPPRGELGGVGSVWPAKCVFRWLPYPVGIDLTLELTLTSGSKERVWSRTTQEHGDGVGDFPEARTQMLAARKVHPNADMELKINTIGNDSSSTIFSLLSEKAESTMVGELAAIEHRSLVMDARDRATRPANEWEDAKRENEVILHIGRASLFQRYDLYSEAAEEMDKALQSASGNADIRRGAIWAHRRSGNTLREMYLTHNSPSAESRDGH